MRKFWHDDYERQNVIIIASTASRRTLRHRYSRFVMVNRLRKGGHV